MSPTDNSTEAGLPAELLTSEAAASLAPDFINPSSVKSALHFPSDGTANAGVITSYYLDQARTRGVDFLEASVTGFATKRGIDEQIAEIPTIRTGNGGINSEGNTVILATGIWTSSLISAGGTRLLHNFQFLLIPSHILTPSLCLDPHTRSWLCAAIWVTTATGTAKLVKRDSWLDEF